MKKLVVLFASVLAVVTMMAPASGATLLFEEFNASTTITFAGINLANGVGSDDNLNQWLGDHWSIQSSGGDYFAQENQPQVSDLTNMMYYGFSAAGIAAGTPLTLDFDYEIADRAATVYVAGLNYGVHELDQWPGFFDDPNDGVVIQNLPLAADYGDAGWQPAHFAFALPAAYDVLVLGFEMGGASGLRAIDTVNFQSSVPEPSTLLLLGSGLVGLAVVGRRRFKK